tara:strand:+ start:18 stop:527 length:510 start_codon:yes stop_codon:yes gene_type:complete
MVLETRNKRKRVQAPVSLRIIEKMSDDIPIDFARAALGATNRRYGCDFSNEVVNWLKAMQKSMIGLQGAGHFQNEYWIRSHKTLDAIRNAVCVRRRSQSNRLFSFEKHNSHVNGYFAFRPISARMTDEIYTMLACMKVLSDSNEYDDRHIVRLYKWIEMEMILRTNGRD